MTEISESARASVLDLEAEVRSRSVQAWARWAARLFDLHLFTGLAFLAFFLGAIVVVAFTSATLDSLAWIDLVVANPVVELVFGVCLTLIVVLILEPIWIAAKGATPGKWIMGIRVRHHDGRKLGYGVAFLRSAYAMIAGLAGGIPFLSLVTIVLSRARLESKGETIWDKHLGTVVHHRKRHVAVWFFMVTFVVAVNVGLGLLSRMEM